MWLISPTLAYNFSELIEAHAVDTYGQFVDENEERLKALPAPLIARRYYTQARRARHGCAPTTTAFSRDARASLSTRQDLYLYDEFQTSRAQGSRRPKVETLYDVFSAIRDDEAEHVSTMVRLQPPGSMCGSAARMRVALQLRCQLLTCMRVSPLWLVPAFARRRARTQRCWCARPTWRRRWRRRRRRRRWRRR